MTKPRALPNNLLWMIEDNIARVNRTISDIRKAMEKTQTPHTLKMLNDMLDQQYQILRDLEKARNSKENKQ